VLEQVPHWEQFQVVVALGAQARKALPTRPGKTIYFTWPIKDPAEAEGSPELVKATFESAYSSLEAHIKELLGAILEEPQTQTKP
jgi:protein-tyrosine-phosphatase